MKDVDPAAHSGLVDLYSDLSDGELVILNESNTIITDITTVQRFRFCQRSGTSLLYSPYIDRSLIVSAHTRVGTAPVQQISYIGYNGSSGSIQAINSNVYMIRILLKGQTKEFGNKQILKFASYKSDSAATQQEVAQGLLDNLIANFADETLVSLKFYMRNAAALNSGDDFDGNFIVVNGTKTATAASSGQYNSTDIAVGDYVRIGATTTTAVAVATSNVYRIMSITGTTTKTITFDRNIEEASGTYATGSNYTQVIPAASLGNFGIKIVGQANPFQVGKWKYFVTEFEIQLQDCGTTTVTYDTAAVQGVNYGAQIQEEQYLLQGNWGNKYRADEWAPSFINDAVATTTYQTANIRYRLDGGEQLGFRVTSPAEVMIAFASQSPYTHANTFLGYLQADSTHFPTATFPDFS